MRNRGGNISLKYKTFITSVLIVFFISLGAVYASDVDNVTMDNSNLIQDDSMLSSYNLEVSSNNSISENNLIDSHNDNLIENSSSSSESYEENVNNDDPVYVDEDYHIDVEDAQNTQIISEDTNSTNNDSNSTNQTYFDSDNVIMYYKNGEVAKNYQPSGKALFSNDDLIELFCETLTSTELSLIKNKAAYFLQVNVVCDSHGNANEVGFGFRNDDPVLTRLLPDRFYDLEQKLKRLLKVNLSTEDIQIKNIKYFAIIDYRQIN